ncbi:MAG: alpha/beta hydrolase [Smithellaceae bacterium]
MAILKLGHAKQIYYESINGEEESPHLVFLHEGLGCTEMWQEFPHTLCKETGCPGIVYDRLGYGRSSPLTDLWTIHYLHKYALIELPEIISQLIPARNYFLIGHSDGGSIALIHASEKPAHLQGIITEAAHVFVEKETLDGIQVAVDIFNAEKLRGLSRYHGGKAEGIFKAWSDTWLSNFFIYWNIEYLLPSIECPVLVLQGTKDQYGTVAQVESIASKALNAQKAMVEACAHVPHQERTDVVLPLMREFLKSQMHNNKLFKPTTEIGAA